MITDLSINGHQKTKETSKLVCYSTQTNYVARYQPRYRSTGYSYTTSCGTWGWSRCSRTSYRSTSYTFSYSEVYYTQVSFCCSGYTGSPPNCQAICSNGCHNGGNCISPEVCSCANGWSGDTCTTPVCPNGCFNGGTCAAPGTCRCSPGWTGNDCRQDINECLSNNGYCDQSCVNELGSYRCECYTGYTKDTNSMTCIDINECSGDHGCHHLCSNNVGSFTCYCNPGYMLDSNGNTCTDINECLVDNGGCEFSCTNLEGRSTNSQGYQCGCDTGYQLAPDNHNCVDILNCLIGDHNCAQICVELEGSFRCSCYSGYELQEDRANCSDIDECTRGLAGCSYNCINTVGSYYCTCMDGFELLADNHTCADIDECALGIAGCQHICHNTDGSFYCSCNDGYTLESDGTNCIAQPCPFLMRPQNGNISCDGEHVTDTTCMFECDLGYGLAGSINRTCLPNNAWSGETTYCNILLCEELENPENGSVLLPCGQEYGTICNIECSPGFHTTVKVPVQRCTVIGIGEAEWTPAPACPENELCTPNPCKHSGICNITGPSSYLCDCNGTGYTGTTCEIGIIEIPDYPPLTLSAQTNFTLFAYPDFELTVRLRSSGDLDFSPSNAILFFSPTQTSADILITGKVAGIFTINYEIGGISSLQFQQPEPDIIIVEPAVSIPPTYFTSRDLESGMLEAGSCEDSMPLGYICPLETDRISFSSTCRWHRNTSPGLIFSSYKQLNLPVAIAGAGITNLNINDHSRVVPLMGNELREQCNFIPQRSSCTFKPSDSVQEIQNFLQTEALAYTYLNEIQQLIPSWLQFSVITDTLRTHDSTSYLIDLIESDSISGIEECPNMFTLRNGMYSVLKYSGSLNFSINSNSDRMISPGSPVCFAVNLCEGLNSPLLITIPDSAQEIVTSLSFAQIIRNYGWEFKINSIALSSTPFSHLLSRSNDDYWFGNRETTYSFLDSTIVADGRFSHSFSLGTLQISYSLEGSAYMSYDNFDMVFELGLENRWDGFMLGVTEIKVSVPIYNETSVLSLTGDSNPVLLSVGGNVTTNARCLGCDDPQGIAFKLDYDIREESTGIWSQLITVPPKLQFGLPTQFSCLMSGFIHFDSGFGLQAISMSSSCVNLQLGNFPIRNLESLFYISNNCHLQGICDLVDSTTINSDVSIYIWSVFPPNIPKLRLGHFMSLLPYSENRFGIASIISSDMNQLLANLFQLRISILGTTLTVGATIDQTGLNFNDTARIFGAHSAMLAGHVDQTNDWNKARLSIFGQMQREFEIILQLEVNKYFNFYVQKNQERTEGSRLSLLRAQEQLNAIQNTNMNNFLSLNRSQNDHNDALLALFIANQTLQNIQDMVDQASEELTDLRMNLDDLCIIRTCPELCIPSISCKTCVANATTPIKGICTVICTMYRRVRRQTGFRPVIKVKWFTLERCDTFRRCFLWFCLKIRLCFKVPVLRSYLTMEPKYGIVKEPYTSTCKRPCQMGSETNTVEARCCALVGCVGVTGGDNSEDERQEGSGIPDPACVTMNKMCERNRQIIFDALEAAEDDSATLLRELQDANRNVSIASLRVMRSMAALTTSEIRFNQSSTALKDAQRIHQIAESAHQQVLLNSGDIQVFINSITTVNHTMPIDIFNITFDITIVTESPTSLPLDVSYHVPLLNRTATTQVIVDFQRINLSLRNAAVFIIEDIFLSNGHSTRSIRISRQASTNMTSTNSTEEPADSNQLYFEEKCSEVSNLQEYIIALNDSISTIVDMAISTMMSVTNSMESLSNLTESSMELFSQSQSVNTTALEMDFNVTINSTTVAESGESETELELLDLLQNLGNLSREAGQDVEVDSFRSWLLQMQDLHNRTATAAGFACFGFSDCLSIIAEATEELLITIPESIAESLLAAFPVARTALLDIVQSTNTVMDVSNSLQKFYDVIGDLQFTDYYCAQPPVIIEQPPQQINPREGSTLQLVCNASSNYFISYKWKRDEIELLNSNVSILIIDDIQLEDSGNYVCEATNHIGTVSTIEVLVEVQQPPEFFLEPNNTDVYLGDWNGATFQCNATGWPYPGFTWHFKPKDSDGDFTEILGAVENEYTIEFPQPEHEGLYYCSANNEQDNVTSRIVELTVLDASVTQLYRKFTVNFTFDNETMDDSYYMDEDNIDSNDTMDDYYLVDEEFRNATDLEQSFIDLINTNIDLQSTIIQGIEIIFDGDELTMSFSLASKYIPYPETSLDDISQLVPLALTEWSVVQKEIVEWITGDNITINSNESIYTSDPSSVITSTVENKCPSGREISSSNNFICANCPPGTYQTTRIDTQLSADDSQSSVVVPQCTECPIGYYQRDQGQINCDKCPIGSTSLTTGSRNCVLWCPPHYYSSTGYEPCSPCPQGSYALINASTACTNCSMSSVNVPTSICPIISTTSQFHTPASASIFISQFHTPASASIFITVPTETVSLTGTPSPSVDSDSSTSDDDLAGSEIVAIVASGVLIAVILALALIVLMILYQKRKGQYTMMDKKHSDTIKPVAIKSSTDGETNHESIFANPAYEDNSTWEVQLEN